MSTSQIIARELPFFEKIEDKENFLVVVGALSTRIISIQKACEILGLDKSSLFKLLDAANVAFSYLDENDIEIERKW